MSWSEFSTLLAGIMPETPLGQIVSIRSENDEDILKNFTTEQRNIRSQWRSRAGKKIVELDKVAAARQVAEFQEMMRNAFS